MNVRPAPLGLEPEGSRSSGQSPTVFVRTFSAPPGLPWDQARVAALEARSGAPLPLADVVYQLRRLDPWFLGRAARYAAFYIRAQDGGDVQRTVEVAGRRIHVHFLSNAQRNRRARSLALLAAGAAGLALVVSGAISSALNARAETQERLETIQQIAAAKLRAATLQERQRTQGHALDSAGMRHLGLSDVLEDLVWASGAKTSGAHIDAWHWDHGHMAVEVRGDSPPFISGARPMVKADKPLRPRVWLWGVEPAPTSGTRP